MLQKVSIDVLCLIIGSILKNKMHSSGAAALLSYCRLKFWQCILEAIRNKAGRSRRLGKGHGFL